MKYGQRDLTIPMRLTVKWAGDTPMVYLDELNIPGLGTYSARVIFKADRYAGTWDAQNAGGHLYGRIERTAPATQPAETNPTTQPAPAQE